MNLRAPIISPMLPEQPERAPWGVFALVAVLCLALFVAACLLLVRPAEPRSICLYVPDRGY